MGSNLERSTALYRGEAAVSSTLGTPPRQMWSTARHCHAVDWRHKTGTHPGYGQRAPKGDDHTRRHAYSARQQEPSTVLPRFGEKETTSEITHTCNPSLLESIKEERSTQTLALTYSQSTLTHLETWELSPSLAQACTPYYKHLGAKRIQCFPPCWTYGLIGRNQDKFGVIVFSLASTI